MLGRKVAVEGDVEMRKRMLIILAGLLLVGAAAWGLFSNFRHSGNGELVLYGNVDIRQVDLGIPGYRPSQ